MYIGFRCANFVTLMKSTIIQLIQYWLLGNGACVCVGGGGGSKIVCI